MSWDKPKWRPMAAAILLMRTTYSTIATAAMVQGSREAADRPATPRTGFVDQGFQLVGPFAEPNFKASFLIGEF